jgi:hypothetical protein
LSLSLVKTLKSPKNPFRIRSSWGASDFEFIELHNRNDSALDISGAEFTDGITFTFPARSTLSAGAYGVVVSNPEAFQARYGTSLPILGVYTGRLSNDGEAIQLLDAVGENVLEFTYKTSGTRPPMAVAIL